MIKMLGALIPNSMKPFIRSVFFFPLDIIENIQGRDSLIPPRSMNFAGQGDFVAIGQEFKRYFIEYAHLQKDHCVLDVGSGIGRMAVPLTDYLSASGEYHGIDIVRSGVAWCQRTITPRFGNFHFYYSDIHNKHYNPKGAIAASSYEFPFVNEKFDFIFLTSVFTHMLPADLENYLSEIARVLKKEGTCLFTLFLVNSESLPLIQEGRGALDFKHTVGECLTIRESDPEVGIAYPEELFFALLKKYGLECVRPVKYGAWCGREDFVSFQDIAIVRKLAD